MPATTEAAVVVPPSEFVTITFDSLTGSNAAVFTGTTEEGFHVVPATGEWLEAHVSGNGVPSIFGRSDIGTVTIMAESNAAFLFESIDFDHASDGNPGTYSIHGSFMGGSVFTLDGPFSTSWITVTNPDPTRVIDLLEVTMTKGSATHNMDNIVVAVIPEPGSVALLSLGVGILAGTRRRRANASGLPSGS